MAVPVYTTDLTTNEIFLDGGGSSWTMIGGGRETDPETDDFIQGSSCWSHDPFSNGIEGGIYNSSQTITSGDAAFFWVKCDVVATLATKAAGGMQVAIGDSATAYKTWYVRGSDDYAAGGWVNVAIDPAVAQSFVTAPAPSTTTSWFGARWNVPSTGAGKGYPMKVDAIRQGRGDLLINGGSDADGLATFTGLAAINDASSARWGLFEALEGGAAGYSWKGLMSFGPTTLTEFTDSNKSIFIENTEYVTASFNRIEFNNVSSVINWTNISFTAIGTVSKGELEMIDDCEFNDTGGVFTDMSTFIYNSNYTGTGRTWRRCGLVTQAGGTFDGCTFDEPSGTVGLLADDLDLVDDCVFNSDGTGHAIELDSSMAGNSYTMSGCSFVGYGSTGTTDAAIYNNTGGTVTIGVGTGQIPTYYNVGVGSVTTITASVLLYVIVKDTDGDPIQNVWVGVYKTSDRTEIKNQETDVNGEVDTSYTDSTPVEVEVRCRKSSSADDPKYINYSSIQTIETTTGLSLSVTMQVDSNNNATT